MGRGTFRYQFTPQTGPKLDFRIVAECRLTLARPRLGIMQLIFLNNTIYSYNMYTLHNLQYNNRIYTEKNLSSFSFKAGSLDPVKRNILKVCPLFYTCYNEN